MDAFWIAHPMYVLSKLFGHSSFAYATVHYYKSSNLQLIDQVASYVTVFANWAILVVEMVWGANAASTMYRTSVGTRAYLWYMKYCALALSVVILLNLLFRQRILRVLHKLVRCDNLLAAVNLRMNAKFQRRRLLRLMAIVVGLTLLVASITATSSLFFYDNPLKVVFVFCFLCHGALASHIYVAWVLVFIGAIWYRFSVLNYGLYQSFVAPGTVIGGCSHIDNENDDESLHHNLAQHIQVCVSKGTSRSISDQVREYANIHHYLCDIVELINFCFSAQVANSMERF